MENFVAASRSFALVSWMLSQFTVLRCLANSVLNLLQFPFSTFLACALSMCLSLLHCTSIALGFPSALAQTLSNAFNIDLHHHQCDVTSLATYKMHWLLRLCFGVLLLVFPGVPLRGCVVNSYLTGYPLWNPTLRRGACHRHLSPVF
jgi:hypothetical protein